MTGPAAPAPEPAPEPAPPPSAVGDDLGLGLTLPGAGTVDERGRRRAHPITPLVHGVSAVPIGIVIFIAFSSNALVNGDARIFGVLVLLLAVPIVVVAWSYLSWRNTWYWFDDDGDFRIDSGVLTRQQRRLQLSRLQSVDVTQPFVARIFSMAELSVEVAGAGDSRARLRYLSLADARSLRNQVLARAAGLRHDAGEAPETPIATVAAKDLLVSLLMRSSTAFLLVVSVAFVAITVLTQGAFGLLLALVTGGVPLFTIVGEFMRYFNFTVSSSPDGLRLRFGMTQTQARTVPPGRVQAIELVEPLLWRRRGWVRLRVNIAGAENQDRRSGREETLLFPVAGPELAADLVQRVLPGFRLDEIVWHSAPERSRWRAPVQWRRLAVGWDGSVLAVRRGRITRRVAVIPHARTQSVRLTQGPWEHRLDLASVHVDSTPGPVKLTAEHLDAAFARQVADEQADRAGQGRASDRSTHWAQGQ